MKFESEQEYLNLYVCTILATKQMWFYVLIHLDFEAHLQIIQIIAFMISQGSLLSVSEY